MCVVVSIRLVRLRVVFGFVVFRHFFGGGGVVQTYLSVYQTRRETRLGQKRKPREMLGKLSVASRGSCQIW